jgi:hypothetical protein
MEKIDHALRKDGSCWSIYGYLMNNANILLNSFQLWYVEHVKRNANETAQRLVKTTISYYLVQI